MELHRRRCQQRIADVCRAWPREGFSLADLHGGVHRALVAREPVGQAVAVNLHIAQHLLPDRGDVGFGQQFSEIRLSVRRFQNIDER